MSSHENKIKKDIWSVFKHFLVADINFFSRTSKTKKIRGGQNSDIKLTNTVNPNFGWLRNYYDRG